MNSVRRTEVKLIINMLFVAGVLLSVELARTQPPAKTNTVTRWQVLPWLKYDKLCFLNLLTGDPFYRQYYPLEYARFEPRLTPGACAALADIKRKLKERRRNFCIHRPRRGISAIDKAWFHCRAFLQKRGPVMPPQGKGRHIHLGVPASAGRFNLTAAARLAGLMLS